jgi:hypothetical protein
MVKRFPVASFQVQEALSRQFQAFAEGIQQLGGETRALISASFTKVRQKCFLPGDHLLTL